MNTYNVPLAVRLKGNLRPEHFQFSIEKLIERHETLRTTFALHQGQLIQNISAAGKTQLRQFDVSGLPLGQREEQAYRLMREEAQHPFNLQQGPLQRTLLIRLASGEHLFILTQHHTITDGWSHRILLQELVAGYEEAQQQRLLRRLPLLIQYADYAIWQHQWQQEGGLQEHLDYWKQQLAEVPMVLDLPTDQPRPAVPRRQRAMQRRRLPVTLMRQVRQVGQQEKVTLFMTLLSVFGVLLGRMSKQEDLLVGTAISERGRRELEGLIGFFVNTLPLRIDLRGQPNGRQLLQRVRKMTLQAYEHRDAPFEQIVEAMQPERGLSHDPLIQVMFVQDDSPKEPLLCADLTMLPLESEDFGLRVPFEITLEALEIGEECLLVLEYDKDLFSAATMQGLLEHFQILLENLVENLDQPVERLPWLSIQEQQQLLVEWNATQADYATEQCIHQIFEKQTARTPEAIALVFGEQQLTYGELNARANQLAHYLQRLGVGPEVCVGLCLERSAEMIIGLLAILKAGGAYVPLDPAYPPARSALMLQETQAPVLLTQQSLLSYLPSHDEAVDAATPLSARVKRVICLDRDWPTLAREDTCNLASAVMAANLAYVIYTSGSTGRPKGTLVEHRGLANLARTQVRAFAIGPSSRVLQYASLSFDAAVSELFTTLLTGATLVLEPKEALYPGPGLVREMQEQAIDVVTLPPSVLSALPGGAVACAAYPGGRWRGLFGGACGALGGRSALP